MGAAFSGSAGPEAKQNAKHLHEPTLIALRNDAQRSGPPNRPSTFVHNTFFLHSITSAHRLSQRVAGWVGGRRRRPEPEAHLLAGVVQPDCSGSHEAALLIRYSARRFGTVLMTKVATLS